jgi:hypothetical protein
MNNELGKKGSPAGRKAVWQLPGVLRAQLSRAGHLISAGLPARRGELGLFSGPFPARCR